MPNRTFAFSHRGGYWKTRYSFFSTCYAYIDRLFVSFRPTSISGATRLPVYIHNRGANCTYYGTAGTSGLSVSFNQNVSQNKILKSVSIEATSNTEGDAVIIANNSTVPDQVKTSPALYFDDKGGILYSAIRGQNVNTNSNVKLVGTLYEISEAAIPIPNVISFTSRFRWADGGNTQVGTTEKFVFSLFESVYSNTFTEEVDLTGTYGAVPDFVTFQYNKETALATFSIAGGDAATLHAIMLSQTEQEVSLFSVSENTVNGDMLRGQYADGVFILGINDYELYALNLEYEPTEYDHNVRTQQANSGRRTRRRPRK